MRIDIGDLNPAVDFSYGDAVVSLRVCASDDYRAIEKKYPDRVEYKSGVRYSYTPQDVRDKRNDDLWDFCIVGWEGLVDKDDNAILCTRENKIMLMRRSIVFAKFVAENLERLTEDSKIEGEKLEKNSLTSQNG